MGSPAMADTAQRFMSYTQTSYYSGMSKQTLRRLVDAGQLKVYRPTGARLIVFDKIELDAFIHGSAAHPEV
jgi:excisionase family DNA binding protein